MTSTSVNNVPGQTISHSEIWFRWFKVLPYAVMLMDAALFEKHFYPIQFADFYSFIIVLVAVLVILIPLALRLGMEKRFLKRALGFYLLNAGFALVLELALILKFRSLY